MPGLLDRGIRVVGKVGSAFKGHEAVATVGSLVDGQKDVGCAADVFQGQREEQLAVVALAATNEAAQLGVVAIRTGDRLGEDCRVGGRAGDVATINETSELAGLEQLPRERVEPDRHPSVVQRAQPVRCDGAGHDTPP